MMGFVHKLMGIGRKLMSFEHLVYNVRHPDNFLGGTRSRVSGYGYMNKRSE